jgi:ABC-type multidrug transport system fused ATPase/permease subunit
MTMTVMYMGRVSDAMGRFFRTLSERYDIMEHVSILEFFLSFAEERGRDRILHYDATPSRVNIEHLDFAYPKAASAEIAFLDIKIKTLKHIIKRHKNNWDIEDLHAYEEAKKDAMKNNPTILKNVNMVFEKGKLYGIVGKNGAGKTTLTSLLL